MSGIAIPTTILDALAAAHPSWRPILRQGLAAVAAADPAYLPALAGAPYLPTEQRLFAAFALPLAAVAYVLIGEGPYPRAESATGVCFMDGAVDSLWSDSGLSKPVNRATSLRNFMKMLLVADGVLSASNTKGSAMGAACAHARREDTIQTLLQLQYNLIDHGFLLLNAALVFRPDVAPVREGKAWLPFLKVVLGALAERAQKIGRDAPTLVLWGKLAEQLKHLPDGARFPSLSCEHPYNLSFISNPAMLALFGPMNLLRSTRL